MSLTLCIDDADVLRELGRYSPEQKEQIALVALRIGLQSLRFAHGELDVQALQRVGEQVLKEMTGCVNDTLEEHTRKVLEEFSLDHDGSALRRLSQTLDGHHQKLHESLDFLRLRRTNRTVLRGDAGFEAEAGRALGEYVRRANDHFEATGAVGGQALGALGRPARVGDFVITLGRDCTAAGEKIVVEAKRDASYNRVKALTEANEARRNRKAQACLFVWDREYGLAKGQPPLARVGSDVIVLWDMADPETDVYLETAYWLARSLVTAQPKDDHVVKAQGKAISDTLDQIDLFSQTLDAIQKSGEKMSREGQQIANNASRIRTLLSAHILGLRDSLAQMQIELPYSAPASHPQNYMQEETEGYVVYPGAQG